VDARLRCPHSSLWGPWTRIPSAILSLWNAKSDITLAEIKACLAEQGLAVGIGTLWRFFRRHGLTLKKSRRMPRSRAARIS
jgi:transposase